MGWQAVVLGTACVSLKSLERHKNTLSHPPLHSQVLVVLASASDQRSVENELVLSLGFEQFELIKELIKNRLRVVWCTKLSRAQVG